jgi:hypothetical protein
MGFSYNNKYLIPAPFLEIKKIYGFLDDGRKVNRGFEINILGKLEPNKGSPNSSGDFHTTSGYPSDESNSIDSYLTVILKKYEAIRSLFSENGKQLKVQGYDGGASLTCNPIVLEISEPKGNVISWAHLADYQVRLRAEQIYIDGSALSHDIDISGQHIEKFEEAWNLEGVDESQRIFRLTHQLSAKGLTYYDTSGNLKLAWQNAENYILNNNFLGIDNTRLYASGVINRGLLYNSGGVSINSELQPFNYLRANSVSETAGTFSVTETWICYDPGSGAYATEEFQIDTRESSDNGIKEVTVQGNIKGLEYRNNSGYFNIISNRWENAQAKFTEVENLLHARAENISELTLNPTPLQKVIGRNSVQGTINYNYVFNNRPEPLTSGALSETISVSYENPCDVFAEIPIVGQASGPIIQGMATYTSKKKSLVVQIVMSPKTYGGSAPTMPNTAALLSTYAPTGATVKKARDVENWSENGIYSRNVSWTYKT